MGTPAAKAAERKRILQERKRERQAQLQLQVDEWFERFDEDHNKQLDRNELRKLLMHLHPDTPVEEEALDYLMKRATEIVSPSLTLEGSADGLIPKFHAVKTVTRYSQYLKNKRELDGLLKRFDSDANGKLEPEELTALLRHISPNVEVTDNDAEFVLENCDRDQDRSISPDELMNAVALWKMLLSQSPVRKRYLAKQTSILSRGRSALTGVAARVAEAEPSSLGPPQPCAGPRGMGRVACGAP